ncbi:methyltransferase domain-containing protein [Umezawaea endophytica]|uniref:Class I SAM-dependent methyltransferase n=1 Tax=Umezawaea endophytica TaxID=1654476 RepID=A0A9X2VI47_9PSEU|nr:class I SAM-dependent methyltransferase [Umezawaea endophytica]MCS7475433.1 class I SAM-dependent methyltransferase [Umezawaea endophytica]
MGDQGLDQAVAERWVERWDRQQERYIADREERFRVIGDVVEHVCAAAEAPVVVDLGCGPGSLSTRLSARVPAARIVGVDQDPFLLALARAGGSSVEYVRAGLGAPGWVDSVGAGSGWDAAVSTTALHWLAPDRLTAVYRDLAAVIRPGGVLVNGDHLHDEQPAVRELAEVVRHRRAERAGVVENEEWSAWWDAVRADPDLGRVFGDRELRPESGGHGNGLSVRWHVDALLAAGFGEVGVVWQSGDDHVVVAVR